MSHLLDDTQERYTPDCGTVEGPVYCGVCHAKMSEERDHIGPRGFVQAMAQSTSVYDVFQCPNTGLDWHDQVIALRNAAKDTPSTKIETLLREEAFEILSNRQATKKVSLFS